MEEISNRWVRAVRNDGAAVDCTAVDGGGEFPAAPGQWTAQRIF